MTTTSEFDQLVRDFHSHLTRDANACVALGVPERGGELPDPSDAEREARVRNARALATRCRELGDSALEFDDRLDLELATLKLESQIHTDTLRFNGRTTAAQKPDAGDAIGAGIFLLFINDPRPDGDRLADVTKRIQGVPNFLQTLLARLDTPVARWSNMDVEKVEALPQLLATIRGWSTEVGWADHPQLVAATESAEAAMRDYVTALTALPTTTRFELTERDARAIVRLRGIEQPLEELHGWARDFLAENRRTIAALHRKLLPKYGLKTDTTVDELQRHLAKRFRVDVPEGDLDAVLRRYEEERERVLDFIEERSLFPIPEAQDMKIMRTPRFMEPSIPAGAMLSPAPFRDGVRTSLIYLTLSAELLDSHTELGIPSMMIHEGIPGHHLQLSTAATHASVVRRHFDAMEHAEGWTTMLEDYMLDQGYMGALTDEARFVGKREINRIGARVAIDLFFMTGQRELLDVGIDCDLSSGDPFEAAGSLLQAATGFVPSRTRAELNWYSQERGYPLCYLTGNRLVWDLKRDLARAQRGRLEDVALDRAFHAHYLSSGNMPLSFLRRVFEHRGLLA